MSRSSTKTCVFGAAGAVPRGGRFQWRTLVALPSLALVLTLLAGHAAAASPRSEADAGMMRLAAGWLDTVFADVAQSAVAVGAEYARLAAGGPAHDAPDEEAWMARATTREDTTGFRTWGEGEAPAAEAAYPSIYRYGTASLTPAMVKSLNDLSALIPVVRSAHASFDFSWVYITTPDELMLIYPYVPISEAIHNDPPLQQIYYTVADTDARKVSWTPPYFDRVGAGMMVTASSPVFRGDEFLGVASRDITLKELSRSVLDELAQSAGATALLVDGRGLAIGASDDAIQAEIDSVNQKAGAANLFFRSPDGLASLGDAANQASTHGWANTIVEHMLKTAPGVSDTVRDFSVDGHAVLGTQLKSTDWFLILVREVS